MVEKGIVGREETKLETGISYILIVGVVISLVLEGLGLILYFQATHSIAIDRGSAMFIRGNDFFAFLFNLLFETSRRINALRLMILGIAILILTPYVRAVASVAYFVTTRNIKYVVITLFVLVILTVSLMAH